MFHCLNKRYRYKYETQNDDIEAEQEELSRRKSRAQKEFSPPSDERRRPTVRYTKKSRGI